MAGLSYTGINQDSQPPVVCYERAPNTNDTSLPLGSRWLDESTSTLYDQVAFGVWQAGGNAVATTTAAGIVVINDDGTLAGAVDTDVPTSLAVKTYADALAIAGSPDASTSVKGIAELCTTAEATTGTDTDRIMTSANVASVLAAPPALGSGTPAAGSFTTLAASGLSSLSGSATILTGGTALNLASDASADAVNLGTGAAARTITVGNSTGATSIVLDCGTGAFNIGTNAIAHTITLGNVTGATAVNINSGTGGCAVASTGGGDITLDSDDTLLLDADGVLELNSSAGAINIGNDAVSQAINVGTGAAARTLTLGNVTGATALVLNCGTGNFALEGNVASTYAISDTGANTGTVSAFGGTGARTVNIAVGGTGAKTVNLATSAIGNIVTIGTVTAAASLDLKCGTGNFTLEGATASTYDISDTGVNTGTVSVFGGTGARTVNIAVGGTGAKTVNLATSAIGNIVTIGTVTAAASLDLKCGTGNFTLEGATASTYDISGTGANTGTISIGTGTGAQTLNLMTGATGIKTTNIGSGAIGNVVAIGSVTGASSLDLKVGTGNFTLEGNVASTYDISGTGANTGIITLGGGTGAQTLNAMNAGTGVKTVNIASGAVANVVTLGSTTGAASLTLQSGTGRTTMTGTVKSLVAEHVFSSGTDLVVTQNPICQSVLTTAVAPTGVDGDVNVALMQDGCALEYFIIGTQTILAPRMSANGLAIELDNTSTDGVEYNFGARSNAKHAYTANTSAAFFVSATLTVVDLSGCGPLMIGFRKVEANNKVIADYTDYFCAGLNSATSATEVVLLDEINGAGQTITNSTTAWTGADTGTCTIKVLVSAAGVCTYTIDGGAPAMTNAMTFDPGDVVMPFIHFLNSADVAGEVALTAFSCGFQA